MSARDRFSTSLRCPYCGSVGSVDYSENGHFYAPPETRIDEITGGFVALSPGKTAIDTTFACSLCGVEAIEG